MGSTTLLPRFVACLLVLGSTIPFSANAHAKTIKVVATTTDIAYLFEAIGNSQVEVRTLAKGYQDPHYLEAKPSYIARMRDADLLGYVGLELEVGWLPLLVEGARNSRLGAGGQGNVPLSVGIEIRDVPAGEVDRSKGDLHPLGNPHYWLDPRNQIIMAETIATALALTDPDHREDYSANLAEFRTRLRSAIDRWEEEMAPFRGRKIVCYHTQWEYLTDWMGLEIVDYVENRPGIPPSPRHLHELKQRIVGEHIPLILMSNFFETGSVEKIAKSTGAILVVAPASIKGEDSITDPVKLFDHLVESITAALSDGDTP